ncbi:MAG: hypothetical protein CO167_03385 [Candidatus Marinimicrobia bacterium CG_4_9_14_3_um_filter_48_9]|nr:MAG: hypothetical protein CO167_03385 [Candidatus Marinimicrobia bacterium CG_4_9_14_3_um_filter_48_9]
MQYSRHPFLFSSVPFDYPNPDLVPDIFERCYSSPSLTLDHIAIFFRFIESFLKKSHVEL